MTHGCTCQAIVAAAQLAACLWSWMQSEMRFPGGPGDGFLRRRRRRASPALLVAVYGMSPASNTISLVARLAKHCTRLRCRLAAAATKALAAALALGPCKTTLCMLLLPDDRCLCHCGVLVQAARARVRRAQRPLDCLHCLCQCLQLLLLSRCRGRWRCLWRFTGIGDIVCLGCGTLASRTTSLPTTR